MRGLAPRDKFKFTCMVLTIVLTIAVCIAAWLDSGVVTVISNILFAVMGIMLVSMVTHPSNSSNYKERYPND